MATKTSEITVIGKGKAVVFKSRTAVSNEDAQFTTAPGPVPPCAPTPAPDDVTISVATVGPSFRQRYTVTLEWEVNGSAPRTIEYTFDY